MCDSKKLFINSLLDELDAGDGLFFERVIILFWNFHASAYERWEDSFDYDAIGCRLHLARQVADAASERVKDSRQHAILECFHQLVFQVHHGAYIENSMICNNPMAFQRHAGLHAIYSSKIIAILSGSFPEEGKEEDDLLGQFAGKMLDYLRPVELQHQALEKVGELMKLLRIDRNKFTREYGSFMQSIRSACGSLEDSGNFESASELRAHIACLENHYKHLSDSRLALQMVDGVFQYGFYIEHNSENYNLRANDRFFADLLKYLDELDDRIMGEATLLNVNEDPAPDILESSIGEEHFQNVLLVFRELQVRELSTVPGEPGHLIAILKPKLYHYALGVGMISFEFNKEELSVPDFYALKHMVSRHSGQFEYWNTDEEGKPVKLYSNTRLVDIARKIIQGYADKFIEFTVKICGTDVIHSLVPWIEVDQAWFTHFEIYRIHDDNGNQLDYESLKDHFEYPGLVSYQRADRASIDDWVNLSVEAMQMKNLAPIRAHKGDLYVISGNHSICYLPDDPKFIVLQYGETSKWVFLIRCLMLYCMSESHNVHARLKKDLSMLHSGSLRNRKKLSKETLEKHYEELIEKRTEVQRHRTLTIGLLEHAVSVGVSQYADHGLLLKRAFEEVGIVNMIDRLQERIEGLASTQDGITVVMEDLKARQEQVTQRRLNLLLFILTIIQIVQSFDVVYSAIHGEKPKFFFPFLLSSLLTILVIAWIYFPIRKFIIRIFTKQK